MRVVEKDSAELPKSREINVHNCLSFLTATTCSTMFTLFKP